MEQTRICISKKTTYIGIAFFLVIGYLTFNYWTLQSNQASNSKAAEPTRTPAKVQVLSPDCYTDILQMCLYPTLLNNKSLSLGISNSDSLLFNSIKDVADDNSLVGIATYYNEGATQKNMVVATLKGSDLKKMKTFEYAISDISTNPQLTQIVNSSHTTYVLYYVYPQKNKEGTQGKFPRCEPKPNKVIEGCAKLQKRD